MPKPPRPWTVLPHSPLLKHEDNLWSVSSSLPHGSMPRHMAIVRLGDGRLVFHNAVPLDERSMADVEAWGEPGVLIVPNGLHRLDVHAFKERYPKLVVLCPAPADAAVRKAVEVDGHYDALPRDPALRVESLDGVKTGEGAFIVTSGDGLQGPARHEGHENRAAQTLLFGDAVMNLLHLPGADGLLLRLLGSTGSPRVTWIARMLMVSNKKALAAHLARLASLPDMRRIVFSHGLPLEEDVAGVLGRVAARL